MDHGQKTLSNNLMNASEEIEPVTGSLVETINQIAASMQKLQASGLTEDAIVLLIHDASKVGKPDIRKVLAGMRALQKTYLQSWARKK